MTFDWDFNHLGMMVSDKEEILEYYQSIGLGVSVGPQPLLPHIEGDGEITFFKELNGEPTTHRYKTGGAHNFRDGQSQIGNCQVEIYPMAPGPGMFISRYLEKKGNGINHIAFNTKNIEADTEYFIKKGCDLVFNVSINGETIENYIDTRSHGDLLISLRPPADDWEKAWRKNNQRHPLVNNWEFQGLGICVNDINHASDYYSELGYLKVGQIKSNEEWKKISQNFLVSKIIFEIIQPESGSIYDNSIKQRDEGVAEIIFSVDNLMTEIKKFEKNGGKILKISENKETASLDSGKKGNILIRLIQKK